STALSVDKMIVRFFSRTSLKQYLPCKPDRYGIKLWGLCAANGYLFNLDVYCGKNDPSIGINLLACALGSRVVLQMINPLLNGLSRKKLSDYHLYFDNFFTSPDLLIHLYKGGLRSTGTVRKARVKEKHEFAKNDSCGITSITPVKRFSRAAQERVERGFPRAFSLYNNYMGGVVSHDFRCKKYILASRMEFCAGTVRVIRRWMRREEFSKHETEPRTGKEKAAKCFFKLLVRARKNEELQNWVAFIVARRYELHLKGGIFVE
ncbi:piggyBac transposable element-derived protein 3-like, partial [Belonocnema kinseyi]|uniref:piggyBac transposable element-derived protein 3-like n=1 Tax=Belonocnema kinseyi TaxID=2817044 RepID=UPI00143D56E4